jgi:hypothetical protein
MYRMTINYKSDKINKGKVFHTHINILILTKSTKVPLDSLIKRANQSLLN